MHYGSIGSTFQKMKGKTKLIYRDNENEKSHTLEMMFLNIKGFQFSFVLIYLVGVSHKYWQCHSWVAVSQTLKFLSLALVRNDIVYSPPARRQCHSLLEQEEEILMSARLPPRNDTVSIYVKPPLNKARKEILNVFLQWEMSLFSLSLSV